MFVHGDGNSLRSHLFADYHILQSDVNHLINSSHHQTSTRLLSTPSSSPLNQSLILQSTNQSSFGNLQSISGAQVSPIIENLLGRCTFNGIFTCR